MIKQNIFFTSDLHIGHKSILKYSPKRAVIGGFSIEDIDAHDKWIINTWNKTVSKHDIVYIIGDFSFLKSDDICKHILPKLNGQKYLILGNHDKSSEHLDSYFQQITKIKEVTFKKKNFEFLDEDLRVIMCHYPMLSWNKKTHGCIDIHGHVHGRLDEYNKQSQQLRIDVGWDSEIANYNLVSLETIYKHMKNIASRHGFSTLEEYSDSEQLFR